jgi:hypothetical protein
MDQYEPIMKNISDYLFNFNNNYLNTKNTKTDIIKGVHAQK